MRKKGTAERGRKDGAAAGGFLIEFLGTDRGWRFEPEGRGPRLIYQISSTGRYRIGRREERLKPRALLFIRGGQLRGKGEKEFIHVQIPEERYRDGPDVLSARDRKGNRSRALVLPIEKPHENTLNNIFIALFREQESEIPGRDAAIRSWLLQLQTFLFRIAGDSVPHWQQNESMTWLLYRNRVLHTIHHAMRNCGEKMRLEDLAEHAGLNRTTFCRIHKALTGKTPMEHLSEYRIRRAKELLEGTDLPIQAVAAEVGIDEVSTFYRRFRRYCDTSPHLYRLVSRGLAAPGEDTPNRTAAAGKDA